MHINIPLKKQLLSSTDYSMHVRPKPIQIKKECRASNSITEEFSS